MNNHTQMIEDEAGEPFGMTYDQMQADYHRLFDLGVINGTNTALREQSLISWEECDHMRRYIDAMKHGSDDTPYWDGYHAAYANTMTPEVLACFEVKS